MTVFVFSIQNLSPKFGVRSLNQVTSFSSEQVVFVSDLNELIIARSPSTFVSNESQVGVSLFTVFTNNLRVVVFVFDEEVLSLFISSVDVDLSKGVVKRRLNDSLIVFSL